MEQKASQCVWIIIPDVMKALQPSLQKSIKNILIFTIFVLSFLFFFKTVFLCVIIFFFKTKDDIEEWRINSHINTDDTGLRNFCSFQSVFYFECIQWAPETMYIYITIPHIHTHIYAQTLPYFENHKTHSQSFIRLYLANM